MHLALLRNFFYKTSKDTFLLHMSDHKPPLLFPLQKPSPHSLEKQLIRALFFIEGLLHTFKARHQGVLLNPLEAQLQLDEKEGEYYEGRRLSQRIFPSISMGIKKTTKQ